MSIRAFRRLSRAERRGFIETIEDPLTCRVFEIAFLGAGQGKLAESSAAAESRCEAGLVTNSKLPGAPSKAAAQSPAAAAVRKS